MPDKIHYVLYRTGFTTLKTAVRNDRGRRGVKLPPLFVKVSDERGWSGTRMHAARLRDKGGYLYLQYRDGGKFRSHYLGIAKKSSPTVSAPGPPAIAAGRGAKKRRP